MLSTEWIQERRPMANGRTTPDRAGSRVKMFVHSEPHEAESALSAWLAEHRVTIEHLAQSQSERSGRFVFVITILYSLPEAY